MEEEEVEGALRLENFGILLYLINNKNREVFTIFETYQTGHSSEYFITAIE